MIPAELHIREQLLEQVIQRKCPMNLPVPKKRESPRRSLPIGDPVGLSFGAAVRAHPELRDGLIESARRIFETGIGDGVLRDFLIAASKKGATMPHVRSGERLVCCAGFVALDAEHRREVLALYGRLATAPELRAVLVEIVETNVLSPRMLSAFLRYLAGPEPAPYSEPAHARALERYWSLRVSELRKALISMGKTNADAVALQYFAVMSRWVHLVRVRGEKHAVVVFGDPTSPAHSVSYAQRSGALQSPAPEFDVVLGLRTARLTRLEELELIRWIELNHLVTRRRSYRPINMPYAAPYTQDGLDRGVEAMCRILTTRRGGAVFEDAFNRARSPRAA